MGVVSRIKKYFNKTTESISKISNNDILDTLNKRCHDYKKEDNKITLLNGDFGTFNEIHITVYFYIDTLKYHINVSGEDLHYTETHRFHSRKRVIEYFDNKANSLIILKKTTFNELKERALLAELTNYNLKMLQRNNFDRNRLTYKDNLFFINDVVTNKRIRLFHLATNGVPVMNFKKEPHERFSNKKLYYLLIKYSNYRLNSKAIIEQDNAM